MNETSGPQLFFDPSALPIAQLESLKFKATQLIDSIRSLAFMIEAHNAPIMPSWPDILAKYNMLLSQTHSFSAALRSAPLDRIALHPQVSLADALLDNELVPLLRNQQTTDVLNAENMTVHRLSEHMATRGSLGVQGGSSNAPKTDNSSVLAELAEIRGAHDARVERAARAVAMLRERFEWRSRVEVELEEPEDVEWEQERGGASVDVEMGGEHDADIEADGEEGQSSDEEAVEEVLDVVDAGTPSGPHTNGNTGDVNTTPDLA